MLIGTTDIDSRRSKRQQIHFLGSEKSDSRMKLGRKPEKIALRPRRFEIHHKFPVKQQEKPHVLNFRHAHFKKIRGFLSGTSYEVMKPVYRIEHHATDTKSHEAGFIDVEALIFKPREFEIRIKGIEREYGNQKHITHLGNESEFQELAQAFVPANVSVVAKGVTTTVWMSVRTGSFTLGEILQELKALRQLGEKTQAVALVVDGLDEKVRVHIEREGFFVIDKSEYGAIGTEC